MSEQTQSQIPDQNEIQKDDPVLLKNLDLLTSAYIPNTPKLSDPQDEKLARHILTHGERMIQDDGSELTAIKIWYNTKTGEIGKPTDWDDPKLRPGEYSVFRTHLITIGEESGYDEKEKKWKITPGKY